MGHALSLWYPCTRYTTLDSPIIFQTIQSCQGLMSTLSKSYGKPLKPIVRGCMPSPNHLSSHQSFYSAETVPMLHRGSAVFWSRQVQRAKVAIRRVRKTPRGGPQLLWGFRPAHSWKPGHCHHCNLPGKSSAGCPLCALPQSSSLTLS